MKLEDTKIQRSVREFVEFLYKSGDIDNRQGGKRTTLAMQEGAALHRKIQSTQTGDYASEVPLSIHVPISEEISEEPEVLLFLEGRADGIFTKDTEEDALVCIDEIKGTYRWVSEIEAPEPVHLAQAQVYAYIYAKENDLKKIGVQITYATLPEEGSVRRILPQDVKRFHYEYSFSQIEEIFEEMIEKSRKWFLFIIRHRKEREASIEDFSFPFPYREGQREIVQNVFHTVENQERLFVQAPTGIGKTLAMLYPSVQAVGRKMGDKIFYLTAKTVTSNVAGEGMRILSDHGLAFSSCKIIAKEKICPLEKTDCNPVSCEFAKGHFDRINDAVFDLITNEKAISGEEILNYAKKHKVCPFELSLDVTYYVDVIICDYNYAFAPHVALQRYFTAKKEEYIFLIDEAHNLVDRGRSMFSAICVKEHVLAIKKMLPKKIGIQKLLEECNRLLLALKRECPQVRIYGKEDFPNALVHGLLKLQGALDRYMEKEKPVDKEILEFYFEISDFLSVYEILDEHYVAYSSYTEKGEFYVKLFCVDPSKRFMERFEKIRTSVLFSATLLPVNYYKNLLTGSVEEKAIYVESPFDTRKRGLLIARDVSSKYTRRTEEEYGKVAAYIRDMAAAKTGNYLVFFPSYSYMEHVLPFLDTGDFEVLPQRKNMSEGEREAYLQRFSESQEVSIIGTCVMGGIFSEGIDLTGEKLIGVIIVGTGLPKIDVEGEIVKNHFEQQGENGFDYSYRFPGFNKVMQAAGRLIRTKEDEGVILLLDERFLYRDMMQLFPKEWKDFNVIYQSMLFEEVSSFWKNVKKL